MTQKQVVDLLGLTAQIVSAYVSNNRADPESLPALIRDVLNTLKTVENPHTGGPESPVPAVPVKKSVFPDYIVCLEDGKKLKMLKRYIRTAYGLSPEDYRARWGLPADYPMVAPNYSVRRSALAKSSGLGRSQ